MPSRGAIIISFDAELAWGAIDNGLWKKRERNNIYSNTRTYVKRLIYMLDELKFPCTWAFVGRMIEDENNNPNSTLVPPNLLIAQALEKGQNSSFDGKDILQMVLRAQTRHEIAWHSYYHINFKDRRVNQKYVNKDLEKAEEIGNKYGVKYKTLVFPENKEGYWNTIAKHKFTCCRGGIDMYANSISSGNISKLLRFLFLKPQMSKLSKPAPGLNRLSTSMFFNPRTKRTALLPLYRIRAIKGIKVAIANKACFHIWVHPFNFAEVPSLIDNFKSVLQFAVKERDKGNLSICTIADYCDLHH